MSGPSRQLSKVGWTKDIVVSYPVPLRVGRGAIRGKNLGTRCGRARENQQSREGSEV